MEHIVLNTTFEIANLATLEGLGTAGKTVWQRWETLPDGY